MPRKQYGINPSDRRHLSRTPNWLASTPVFGAQYIQAADMSFEVVPGHIGYHVDRITEWGTYLGETSWVLYQRDVLPLIEQWHARPPVTYGEFEVEDIFGDDDGNLTPTARAWRRRHTSGARASA